MASPAVAVKRSATSLGGSNGSGAKRPKVDLPTPSGQPKSVALNRMLSFLTNDVNKNEMISDLRSRLNSELDERKRRDMIEKAKRVLKRQLNASDAHLKAFEEVINAVYEEEKLAKKASRVRKKLCEVRALLKKESPRIEVSDPPKDQDPWNDKLYADFKVTCNNRYCIVSRAALRSPVCVT